MRFAKAGCLGALWLLTLQPAWAEIKVRVEGLEEAEAANVESRLAIRAAADREDLDEPAVRGLHQRAEADIRLALQPFGYYQPVVQSWLSGSGENWRARYRIDPGPRTLIQRVDLVVEGEARELPAVQEVLQRPRLRVGDGLLHERYEDAKTRLQQAAYNGGYLDAAFTRAELRVQPSAQSAEVLLTLDSGPRYYFGEVTLETQGLDEPFLRNYLKLTPGEPFDPQKVLATQFALTDLDYFQTVEIIPERDRMDAEHRIPLTVRTTSRPRRRYELGPGYGTDTGARLTSAVEFRRIGERGHKLRAEARLSEIKNTFGGEYRIPLGTSTGESVSFTATSTSEKLVDDGESLKYTLGASLTRVPGKWRRRLYLEYAHEDSLIAGERDSSDLFIPGMSLNRGETDDPIHTRKGWSVFGDVHGASKLALSTTSFLQLRGQARGALPMGDRMRLLGRVELGATFVEAFSDLPASQRFFAGGDQSVRGYSYQSLGPRDENGLVVGGRFLTTFSVEAEYLFRGSWRDWGAAAFFDSGGADDDPWPQPSSGVGVGGRYRAPIGYINVDLAHPLDGERSGVRLHVSVRVGL